MAGPRGTINNRGPKAVTAAEVSSGELSLDSAVKGVGCE